MIYVRMELILVKGGKWMMRSVGVVVEYNPFHNGHLYHIQSAKQLSKSDITIALMSGNFLQRGEPALVSKWARTKMALHAGVDIVIEIPYAFAVQQAETFAFGSVYILDALKCNGICFGSESGDVNHFVNTYTFLEQHRDSYEHYIRTFIKEGVSYPTALAKAFDKLQPDKDMIDLSKPNNILGYHYYAAAKRLHSSLDFYTVKRKNAEYHDQDFSNATIASATSIRKALQQNGNLSDVEPYLPKSTTSELESYHANYGQFHDWEVYWPLLQYQLFSHNETSLREIYEVEEGIENRLLRAAKSANSFETFMQIIKTKRYTWTRLQRMCVHILTNTPKSFIHSLGETPSYARLLGMSEAGRVYLNQIKRKIEIPLVSKVSAFDNEMIQLDVKAANVYATGLNEPYKSKLLKQEFAQPPVYLKERGLNKIM